MLLQWIKQGYQSIPTLLLTNYKEMGLTEVELVALIHIQSFIECGDPFPTPELLSERMTISTGECADLIGRLVRGQFVSLEKEKNEDGIVYEYFTLDPLWKKIFQTLKGKEMHEKELDQQAEEGHLFRRFEEEFGRMLSPIEAETLSIWLDQDEHTPPLILAALREAVISGKLNFRYIDRILFEWKKNGVKTIDEAKEHSERFRKYNRTTKRTEKDPQSYPSFNWLEQS